MINEVKGYSFSTYINNLRIEYVILLLKEDKKIRKYEEEKNLPETLVVALTANALSEHKKLCLDSGMNDYFTKPITLETIDVMLNLIE